jgi:ribosomal protein S18 acetylase RimI-like enzyme
MKVRPGTRADMPRLYEIHRAALGPYVEVTWGWDEGFQASEFRRRGKVGKWQVIDVDGQIAGFIEVDEQSDRIVLNTIELAPEYQGRGMGTKLVSELLSRARKRHLPVQLRVLKCNPARALYERLGFRVAGETETHILMRTPPAL